MLGFYSDRNFKNCNKLNPLKRKPLHKSILKQHLDNILIVREMGRKRPN